MEIRTGSVSFTPLRGSGPRMAQATVVFPRTVVAAAAGLTNYSVGFAGDDHHLGRLQIQLDTQVNGAAVIVEATYGLRDWSGNWDDDYQGTIEFAVFAELISQTLPPPRGDLLVAEAEWNQATQFFHSSQHLDPSNALPDNAIRLVAGKNTGVRLYVDYERESGSPAIATLSGALEVRTASGAAIQLAPLSTIAPQPQVAIDRGNVAHTLNFMIPGLWCHDQVTITAVAFDAAQPSPTSAPFIRTVRFIESTPLEVHGVGIHYTGQGLDLAAPSQADFAASLDFTERVYPVGEVIVGGYETHDYGRDLKPSDDGNDTPGYDGLLDLLLDLRGGGDEAYLAVLPNGGINVQIDTTGWSIDGIERSGVGISFQGDGKGFAHEIAHAFGRDHAPCDSKDRCDDPDSPDSHYPHYGTYPSDSIGEYGFDPVANSVMDPATTFDIMGYSSSAWTSPYTYTALMGALPPTGNGPGGASNAQRLLRRMGGKRAQGMGLWLRFLLLPDGGVRLQPSFSHEVVRVPLHGCSAWQVEQRAADGKVLSCMPIELKVRRWRCMPIAVRQLLPLSKGAATLAVMHAGREVCAEPFEDPPTVQAGISKDGDHMVVQWKGSEKGAEMSGEKGGELWAIVQGLDAGGVWRGLSGRTQQREVRLDLKWLAARRISRARLLVVRNLATTVVNLEWQGASSVATAEIVTRVVAPGVLKAWIVGADGAEHSPVIWTDEFGSELGRGHTLDLRGHKRPGVLRVLAQAPSRLVAARLITLDPGGPGGWGIASDIANGRVPGASVAAHRGKPDHSHKGLRHHASR